MVGVNIGGDGGSFGRMVSGGFWYCQCDGGSGAE